MCREKTKHGSRMGGIGNVLRRWDIGIDLQDDLEVSKETAVHQSRFPLPRGV